MTPEAQVRNPTVAFAKSLGVKHIRFTFRPGVKRGLPDDMFLIPGGRPLFIEFKRPGKEPTPLQAHNMKVLHELGYAVCWHDNSDAACEAVTRAVDASRVPAPGCPVPH